MSDQRVITERRADNKAILASLQDKLDKVHDRVYNGLGKEIREEVAKEIGGIRKLVVGLLISLIIALFGVVVTGMVNSGKATYENDRNYKAIVDIGSRLENHIITTVKP